MVCYTVTANWYTIVIPGSSSNAYLSQRKHLIHILHFIYMKEWLWITNSAIQEWMEPFRRECVFNMVHAMACQNLFCIIILSSIFQLYSPCLMSNAVLVCKCLHTLTNIMLTLFSLISLIFPQCPVMAVSIRSTSSWTGLVEGSVNEWILRNLPSCPSSRNTCLYNIV